MALQESPVLPIRSSIGRALYYKMLNDEELRHVDKSKWYSLDIQLLNEKLQSRFARMTLDRETEEYLLRSEEKSNWVFIQIYYSLMKSILSFFMSSTSINGLLNRGSMFVFSNKQFLQLVNQSAEWRAGSLLDLGAGDGEVTAKMAPHFETVYVTEMSKPMQWRLESKNYRVLDVDVWQHHRYDVITCLNLLDRCERPLSLMREVRRALRPNGVAIVALVLPFRPYVEYSMTHEPLEHVSIVAQSFEAQVEAVVKEIFEATGFDLVRFTRLPYLSEGDLERSFYVLDDFVFVLRARDCQ